MDAIDKNKKMLCNVENSTARDVRMLQISYNILEIENGKLKKELQEIKKQNDRTAKKFSTMIQFYQMVQQENHRIKLQNRLLMAEFESLKSKMNQDDSCSSLSSECDEYQEMNIAENENNDKDYDAGDELDIPQESITRNQVIVEHSQEEIISSDRSSFGPIYNKEPIRLSSDHIINSGSDNLLDSHSSTTWLALTCSLLIVCLQLLVLHVSLIRSDNGIFAIDALTYCVFDNHSRPQLYTS